MKLLVYIPSYNRAASLLRQIRMLKAYAGPGELEVLVQDNCSNQTSYDEVRRFCAESNFAYIRNPCNIGPNPNILAGFLYCDRADYIWLLSDDDLLKPGALNRVFDLLDRHTGCDLVYLTHNLQQQEEVVELDQAQLLQKVGDGLGLISQVIYRSAKVMPYIRAGYDNLISCFPHLAILFEVARNQNIIVCLTGKGVFFSDEHLPPAEPLSYVYSFFGYTLLANNLKEELRRDFLTAWLQVSQLEAIKEYSQCQIHAAASFALLRQYVPGFSGPERGD